MRPLLHDPARNPALALAFLGGLAACAQAGAPGTAPAAKADAAGLAYQGVDTRLLGDDLVEFRVALKSTAAGRAASARDVEAYARCAAAQYTLIRGYGFVRHLRTTINEKDGVWTGDAFYTISPALPEGLKTIDAEVTAADCAQNGIPMV